VTGVPALGAGAEELGETAGELGAGVVAGVPALDPDTVASDGRSKPNIAAIGSTPARLKAIIRPKTTATNRKALNSQRTTLLKKPPFRAPRRA
jgi:hypothetical protein